MRVPTTDYSPLRQANSVRTQAKRSQFIAPNMEYQRKSLELKSKGLESTMSYLNSQETLGTMKFINSTMTNLISAGLGAMEAKQGQQAQAMTNQMSQDMSTFIQQGIADGTIYYDYDEEFGYRLQGADKIQAFQNQQMQTLQDQGWLRNIEQGAVDTMNGFYSGMQNSMAQDFYVKLANDKAKLEQVNLQNAIDSDMAETNFTDYRATDRFISSLQGYNEYQKAMMTQSAHAQIDLGRASDTVRLTAANQGTQAAVDYANTVSDQRKYGIDTRNRLIGLANTAGRQAQVAAMNNGATFVEESIQTAQANNTDPDFISIYGQAKNNISGMSKEAGKAYMDAVKAGHLEFVSPVYSKAIDSLRNMSPTEVDKGLKDLPSIKHLFDGSEATESLYRNLEDAYKDKQGRYNELLEKEEYQRQAKDAELTLALADSQAKEIERKIDNKQMGVNEGVMELQNLLLGTPEKLDGKPVDAMKFITFNNTLNKMIDKYTDEYVEKSLFKDQIHQCMTDIDNALYEIYAKDPTFNVVDVSAKAKGALIDLARDGAKTDAEFAAKKDEIMGIFVLETHDKLTAKPKEDSSGVRRYAEAINIAKEFENNPSAVYYKENVAGQSGEWVWLGNDLKENFDNASRILGEMLENEYDIDIDKTKPTVYGNITDRYNMGQAETKGLVPVFTAKDGKQYTVQDGNVYRYWHGKGVEKLQPKDDRVQKKLNQINYRQ